MTKIAEFVIENMRICRPYEEEMSFTDYVLKGDSKTTIFVQSSDGYGDANISEQAEFTNPA